MCKEKERIQFCTCERIVELDDLKAKKIAFESTFVEGEYTKKFFIWKLDRILEKIEEKEPERYMVMGSIVFPKKRYENKVTIRSMMEELNEGDVFDFEYTPVDGDEITIYERYEYIYLKEFPRSSVMEPITFVYENNKWYFGYVCRFEYIKQRIYSGVIKKVSNETASTFEFNISE